MGAIGDNLQARGGIEKKKRPIRKMLRDTMQSMQGCYHHDIKWIPHQAGDHSEPVIPETFKWKTWIHTMLMTMLTMVTPVAC